MRIALQTHVEKSLPNVKAGFNESLFSRLSPPFPPVKILRFEGSKAGDIVSLELNFVLFKQTWTSKITEDKSNESEFYFVDEGIELPFFLKKWKHKHRIIKSEKGTLIRDEIDFQAPFALMTLLLYPALLAQFLYRKPIYRKVFRKDQDN